MPLPQPPRELSHLLAQFKLALSAQWEQTALRCPPPAYIPSLFSSTPPPFIEKAPESEERKNPKEPKLEKRKEIESRKEEKRESPPSPPFSDFPQVESFFSRSLPSFLLIKKPLSEEKWQERMVRISRNWGCLFWVEESLPEEEALLSKVIHSVNHHLCSAERVPASRWKKMWQQRAQFSSLRLSVITEKTLCQLPEMESEATTPLLSLLPLNTYLKDPVQKKKLWSSLCHFLQK